MATKKTPASKAVKATTTTAKADVKTEKVASATVAPKATEKVTAPVKTEATKKVETKTVETKVEPKAETKPVEKAEPKKAEKVEEKKVEKVEEKAPAKKAPAKKTTTKKTTAKKPAKKVVEKTPSKRVPTAKKAETPAKVETAVNVFVEYNGATVALEDVINNVKIVNGKDAKEINIYLKPEDQKAYFVADGEEKEMDVFFC